MKNSNDTIANRTRDLKQLRHRVPQKYVKLRPYRLLRRGENASEVYLGSARKRVKDVFSFHICQRITKLCRGFNAARELRVD
jgi:hypothetical protein